VVDHQNAIRLEHGLTPDADLTGFDGARWFTNRPIALRDPGQPMPEPLGEIRPGDGDRLAADRTAGSHREAGDRRPLLAVTLGTVNAHRIDLLRPIVDGLAALDVDAVVGLGGDPATLGPVAANIHVERYVPMSDLLPRSAVAIHHAGSGTTLAAAAAGVPSVMVPITADQPDNAAAVVRAGAGRVIELDGLTSDVVADVVRGMLDDAQMAARARTLAEGVAAMPDAAAAWSEIESLV
jgi:MGT family glycosyltransferase